MTSLSKEDKSEKLKEILKALSVLKNAEPAGLNKARLMRIIKQLEVVVEINEKE